MECGQFDLTTWKPLQISDLNTSASECAQHTRKCFTLKKFNCALILTTELITLRITINIKVIPRIIVKHTSVNLFKIILHVHKYYSQKLCVCGSLHILIIWLLTEYPRSLIAYTVLAYESALIAAFLTSLSSHHKSSLTQLWYHECSYNATGYS